MKTFLSFHDKGDFHVTQEYKVVTLENDITEDNCYDPEDIVFISSMAVGQMWTSPNYGTSHTITRMS